MWESSIFCKIIGSKWQKRRAWLSLPIKILLILWVIKSFPYNYWVEYFSKTFSVLLIQKFKILIKDNSLKKMKENNEKIGVIKKCE